jgi:hypothetical protein
VKDGAALAGTHSASHAYHSVVPLDDPLRQRETQPGAVFFLGSEEWFKNLVGMLGSNTVPVVGNYEADLILQFSGPQIKYSAVRQCIQGVHDQIRHDLQHLARMHLRYQVPWQILEDPYGRSEKSISNCGRNTRAHS